MKVYDAIVVGTGGIGAAALYALARRGARALGLDRFPPGHDRGSSHGQTRIIRQAYFEHPDYVPLLLRCYPLWRDLEGETGRRLYLQTGLVQIGPAHGPVVQGVLQSAARHGLAIQHLAARDIQARWPLRVSPDGDWSGLFEEQAGLLLVEECVLAHLDAARNLDADLEIGATVVGWNRDGDFLRVQTQRRAYVAHRLIVTVGPWAGRMLAELGLDLEIRKKPLYWYASDDPRLEAGAGMPAFLYGLPEGIFYGFPQRDDQGVKLARHSGGEPVEDPWTLDRQIDAADRRAVEAFAAASLPGVSRRLTNHAVCMYTMTPDEHFIVDRHPVDPYIVLAAGLSGHGFKFAPVLGEALADLALEGMTSLPIEFLSLSRPGLRGDS